MKVTTGGQVTIPQVFRERLGMAPGCEVEFVLERGRLILRRIEGLGRGRELVERMSGQGNVGMSTDEILALMRRD